MTYTRRLEARRLGGGLLVMQVGISNINRLPVEEQTELVMNYRSDNRDINTKQRHNRFRDGIIWGVIASLFLFFMNPFMVFPATFVFAAVAGYRGKSIRPALGAIVTVFLIAGISFLCLYTVLSGINT